MTAPASPRIRRGRLAVLLLAVAATLLLGLALLNAGLFTVQLVSQRASRDGGSMWWRVPLYGFQGEGEGVFTGYFYGSAGLGLALLQAHHAQRGSWPRVRFPDDPFPRRGSD